MIYTLPSKPKAWEGVRCCPNYICIAVKVCVYNEILISSFLAAHWAGINQWDLSWNQPGYARNATLGPQCVYISPPLSKQPTENPIANQRAGCVGAAAAPFWLATCQVSYCLQWCLRDWSRSVKQILLCSDRMTLLHSPRSPWNGWDGMLAAPFRTDVIVEPLHVQNSGHHHCYS